MNEFPNMVAKEWKGIIAKAQAKPGQEQIAGNARGQQHHGERDGAFFQGASGNDENL